MLWEFSKLQALRIIEQILTTTQFGWSAIKVNKTLINLTFHRQCRVVSNYNIILTYADVTQF